MQNIKVTHEYIELSYIILILQNIPALSPKKIIKIVLFQDVQRLIN